MELDITIGGVDYNISIDVDDGYVDNVNGVSVYTRDGLIDLELDDDKCDQFFERYEDDLNEAYQDHLVAVSECAAEEMWERREDR